MTQTQSEVLFHSQSSKSTLCSDSSKASTQGDGPGDRGCSVSSAQGCRPYSWRRGGTGAPHRLCLALRQGSPACPGCPSRKGSSPSSYNSRYSRNTGRRLCIHPQRLIHSRLTPSGNPCSEESIVAKGHGATWLMCGQVAHVWPSLDPCPGPGQHPVMRSCLGFQNGFFLTVSGVRGGVHSTATEQKHNASHFRPF